MILRSILQYILKPYSLSQSNFFCGENVIKFILLFNFHCLKSVQIWSFFWSVFFCIWTEYGDLRSKSPYSVRIQNNTDQKKLRIWTLFTQCSVYPIWIFTCKTINRYIWKACKNCSVLTANTPYRDDCRLLLTLIKCFII